MSQLAQTLFPDLDPVDRIHYLESNAVDILENEVYDRPLSEEEIADEKTGFAKMHMELNRLEQEKKDTVEALSNQIKSLKKDADKSLQKIKTGKEEQRGTLYEIQDFEAMQIGIYNKDGQLVGSRPMTAKERQMPVFGGRGTKELPYTVKVS